MPPHHPRPPPPPSPLHILTQILTLQLLYYLLTTSLLLFTALLGGRPFTANLVLDWRSVRGDTVTGWTLGGCWVGGGFLGIILLLLLIARSKLVPDFALTLHFIHLIIVSIYSRGVPRNALWWGLNALSAVVMTVGGVWSCRWRELRPISFGTGGGKGGGGGKLEIRV
ncbi:hypothetical protein JMJ35_000113 [Cladonia borealis]|uniref:Integral membrane protein n=1 Tax=Cladonia borealis TaxID=184061 RepID=A0AA39V5B6_9LECA|nr:hypothetical protein JMJ35_000113 [Cladonia borealis]